MTTMTTTPTTISRIAALGAASGVVAATLALLFAHDWTEVAVVGAILAVVTPGVYGYVVPRALGKESAGGTALGLAIPAALLSVPAFWSGLPFVLGIAAMVVGSAGRRSRTGSGASIAALVLGALTVLFYVSIYVVEAFAGNTGFLFD